MSTVAEPVAAVRMTASPRLAFRDPAKAIELYKQALGAKETFRFEVAGSIPHAELMIGDSTIDVTGEWEAASALKRSATRRFRFPYGSMMWMHLWNMPRPPV